MQLATNLTTTTRRYSIVVEADIRRQAAKTEWAEASEAVLKCRNSFTEARLIKALAAYEQAQKDYYSLTKKTFPEVKHD